MDAVERGLLIGRDAELGQIAEHLAAAVSGRGSLVVLYGAAGIGKTRLAEAVLADARTSGFRPASAANYEHARAPLGPIADLLRSLAAESPELLEAAPGDRSALDGLLGTSSAASRVDQRRLFVIIAEALGRVAAHVPLLMTLDDAQWSDPETVELLRFLAPRVASMRTVLLLTVRAGDDEREAAQLMESLERFPATSTLEVAALNEHAVRAIVSASVPAARRLRREVVDEICRRAEGNPLFVHTLLRESATRRGGGLPVSLPHALSEHLRRLDAATTSVLEGAAVLGRDFRIAHLEQLLDVPGPRVVAALRLARDAGVIVESDAAAGRFTFAHELLRASVYERMLGVERTALHRRAAEMLEGTPDDAAHVLAHHWQRAGDDDRSAVFAERAGDEAAAIQAHASARDSFAVALNSPTLDAATRARVAQKLANAVEGLGDAEQAALHYAAAAEYHRTQRNDDEAALLDLHYAASAYRCGMGDEVLAACRRALATTSSQSIHFGAHSLLAMYHAYRFDIDNAVLEISAADAIEGEHDIKSEIELELTRAAIAVARQDKGWRLAMQRAIELAEKSEVARYLSLALINFASRAREHGLAEAAEQAGMRAIEVADQNGLTFAGAYARCEMVEALHAKGDLGAAYRTLLEIAALHVDALIARIETAAVGVPLLVDLGRLERMPSLIDPALLDAARATGEVVRFVSLAAAYLQAESVAGHATPASGAVAEALAMAPSFAFCSSALYRIARYGGPKDVLMVGSLLGEIPATGPQRLHHLAVQALVEQAEGESKSARLKAAVLADAAERACAPLIHAFALELQDRGADALTIYRKLGAEGHVARLSAQRANKLTRRETEIADLVIAGHSNRAIAEQLVLSERTVEHHVAAIYAKSGVRSRAELVDAARSRHTAASALRR